MKSNPPISKITEHKNQLQERKANNEPYNILMKFSFKIKLKKEILKEQELLSS